MPTIAFVSPKGGVGKTTSAFLFATAIAKLYAVTVIDADPNHPIQTWATGGNTPERLTIMAETLSSLADLKDAGAAIGHLCCRARREPK